MRCPLCTGNKLSDWQDSELAGLKYILDTICPEHRPAADERLKNFREPKIYTLKTEPPTPKVFVPKQVQVKPDWNEKEPMDAGYRADGTIAPDYDVPCGDERPANDGSLIE